MSSLLTTKEIYNDNNPHILAFNYVSDTKFFIKILLFESHSDLGR